MECLSFKSNKRLMNLLEDHKNDDSSDEDDDDDMNFVNMTKDPFRRIRRATEYIQKQREPEKIASNKKCVDLLLEMNRFLYEEKNRQNEQMVNYFCKAELDIIFVDLIKTYFRDIKNYVSDSDFYSANKQKYIIMTLVLGIIWKMTDYSHVIRVRLHRQECTKVLLEYIVDEELIRDLVKGKGEQLLIKESNMIKSLCGTLHNISKISDLYKYDFNKLEMSSKLIKFVKQQQDKEGLISVYLTIANVIIDKDIERISEIKRIIKEIIKLVRLMTQSIKSGINLKRVTINTSDEVATVDYADTQWNLIELLDGLYRFSINDSIKYYIYEDERIKDDAERILDSTSNSTQCEKYSILKLLWQLCFDQRIIQSLLNRDRKLYSILNDLSSKQKHAFSIELSKLAVNLIWSIKNKRVKEEGEETKREEKMTKKTIMISYQHEDKELCLRIKEDLEAVASGDYKVLIDCDSIHGSTLEWMANTIEKSDYFIMCATEQYKQSSNCRAEAEYAFKKKSTTIIPCCMQSNYTPDGWLGIVVGSKMFIDFTFRPYDEAIEALKTELAHHQNQTSDVAPRVSQVVVTPVDSSSSSRVSNWTIDNVNKWLNDKRFDYRIKRQFQNSSGHTLTKFYATKTNAPEYFYSAISKNGAIEVCKVFEFISELEKILL